MLEVAADKPRVVIVDDDRDMRELLAFALEEQGYEVGQVPNGLRLISTLIVDRPDLILLDVNLSWIDGFELCRAVKKNPEFRDIPILFVSGRSSDQDIEEGVRAGGQGYFTKPLDLEVLFSRVGELVQEHRRVQESHRT